MMEIKLVTREEANQIFDTREPIGLFYEMDGDSYIGIDNSTGDAWVEEFKTKEECFKWLNNENDEEICISSKEKQRKIYNHYGLDHQLDKLEEECLELALGIKHRNKPRNADRKNLIEEMADVLNLIEQISDNNSNIGRDLRTWKNHKVNRELERIKNRSI